MKKQMPRVLGCEVTECTFNNGHQCSANAITVGGPEDLCPKCDTFFQMQQKGGNKGVIAGVGACKVQLCGFNKASGCSARGIRVILHDKHADCATYQSS